MVEGVLWGGIIAGKGLQQIFWLRWRQMIVEVEPIQNVPFASIINQSGKAYCIDPTLIAAVIRCESSFNPRAVSSAGAVGLMQISLPTWREIKRNHHEWQGIQSPEGDIHALYQPQINIAAGTAYLHAMLLRYQGDPVKAVAAYNAGPGSVDRYKGVPPYRETKRYVHHVAAVWREYRGIDDASVVCYQWGYVLERTGLCIQLYILWAACGLGCIIGIRRWIYRRKRRW
jgi:soluble lytic murein transglycosylase-like protein